MHSNSVPTASIFFLAYNNVLYCQVAYAAYLHYTRHEHSIEWICALYKCSNQSVNQYVLISTTLNNSSCSNCLSTKSNKSCTIFVYRKKNAQLRFCCFFLLFFFCVFCGFFFSRYINLVQKSLQKKFVTFCSKAL
jgi:hypothetical protein